MNIYLRSCIDFSEDLESRNEDESLREKYKAFGLLLSGCIKGKPESKIETKVFDDCIMNLYTMINFLNNRK